MSIDELDLLRRAGEVDKPSAEVCDRAFEALAQVLSEEGLTGLSEGGVAPRDSEHGDHRAPQRHATRMNAPRRRARVLVGAMASVAAAALLLVFLLPSVGQQGKVAAATELRQIATIASTQNLPPLGRNQLLMTKEQVSLVGQVTQIGSTPTPNAKAVIGGTIRLWTDAYDDSCIATTSGPAVFASSANQAAWTAAGLLVTPRNQPSHNCASDNTAPGSGGVIDVANLPTNAKALALQLEAGTTGIPQVDQFGSGNPGFERAALLLMGPTVGATPSYSATLYNALALIPGVNALGDMTTHSGAVGVGFAATSSLGTSTIIIDPKTGAFLEARNFEAPLDFVGIGASYLAPPPTPSITTEGGSGGTTIQWLDPIGSPIVVGANSLPSGVVMPAPSSTRAQVITSSIGGRASIIGAPTKADGLGFVYLQVCPAASIFKIVCNGQIAYPHSPIPTGTRLLPLKVPAGRWQAGLYYYAINGQIELGKPVSLTVGPGQTVTRSFSVHYVKPAATGSVTLTGTPSNFKSIAYMGVEACPSAEAWRFGCAGGQEAYEDITPGSTYSINLPSGSWNVAEIYRPLQGLGLDVDGTPVRVISTPGQTKHVNLSETYRGL
jgi:hypothetical protein